MFLNLILLQAAKGNLILGVMPESLGLLVFGVILVGSTIVVRRVLSEAEEALESEQKESGK